MKVTCQECGEMYRFNHTCPQCETKKAMGKAEERILLEADGWLDDLRAAEAREAVLREALREVDHILSNTGGSDLGAIISAGMCVDKALSNPSPRAEAILKVVEAAVKDREAHDHYASNPKGCQCLTCQAVRELKEDL